MSRAKSRWGLFGSSLLLAAAVTACSTGPKRTTPELSELQGKKVALVQVESEPTARKVVETALVNQLTERGTFILVSKQDVEAARTKPHQDPLDWKSIAKNSGAEYALKARVLEFNADVREGYNKEEVEDSQLAQERGDDGKTERLYKVRQLQGKVRVELTFAPTSGDDIRVGIAEASDTVTAEAKRTAAHLPPRLRFLETLTNKAFREFFNTYN